MTLPDLRKIAVKKNLRIRFGLPNGMECLLDEHGVARVAALRTAPDFNLENEAARARSFTVESDVAGEKTKVQTLTREELAALASTGEAARGEPED